MKITRIRISNYRGISARDEQIGAAGAIVKGRNAAGKTSVLRAIRSALAALDVGPDAIRLGSDKAEVLVDLDDITVRRLITPKTTSVTVTRDGFEAKKPQSMLNDLLGTSPLDPLDLFLSKPKERRAKVLEALPVKLTLEQLRTWAPDVDAGDLRMLGADLNSHGLEALGRVRQGFYDRRTAANRAHDEARREAERLRAEADTLGIPHGAADTKTATAELDDARDEARRLYHAAEAAKAAKERTATTRAKIAKLREDAEAQRTRCRSLSFTPDAEQAIRRETAAADEALRLATERAEKASSVFTDMLATLAQATAALDAARTTDAQASELEATIAAATAPAPSVDDVQRIAERVKDAERSVAVAKLAGEANDARARAVTATALAEAKAIEADKLDAIVKRLTNDAPTALLAQANGIPGLSVDGDDVVLDGVHLEALSGAEQMRFAIDVAKRLNAKSRILICDGLERLDPEQMDLFVRTATAGDWQLIGTRVDRGEVVVEALEVEAAIAAE